MTGRDPAIFVAARIITHLLQDPQLGKKLRLSIKDSTTPETLEAVMIALGAKEMNPDSNLDGSGKGILSVISKNQKDELRVVAKSAGTVDYLKGEIILNTLNITSTSSANNLIEIQAFPDSNDIIGLKDLYLTFDVSNSRINMVKDVIASGEDVSGVVFSRDYYTSSYSNGDLERK